MIAKVKNTVPWIYVISDVKGEEIIETFYEKELQKPNQKEFWIEKVTRHTKRCYNRDDLLHLNFSLKISIF